MYKVYQNNTFLCSYDSESEARGCILDMISGLFHPCENEIVSKIDDYNYEFKGVRYSVRF